jgi:O-succinylbenzoic acid--CoA ligase
VLIGGAALPQRLSDSAREAGIRVVSSYGMTETCGGVVLDGRPLPGVTVAVAPLGSGPPGVGRLRITGAVVAAGYRDGQRAECWNRDDHGDQRGFLTSDLGSVADDGRVRVLGRIDDVVQIGGVNVGTGAVAAELADHPDVREAEVVAVPDLQWGVHLVAFVVTHQPGDAELVGVLRDRVRVALGRPAVPTEIRFLRELPRLPGGKPDRQQLAEMAAG